MDEAKDKKTIAAMAKKKNKGAMVCPVEVIFEGILTQKLDFKKHSLIK
jgi:hypothetical protein